MTLTKSADGQRFLTVTVLTQGMVSISFLMSSTSSPKNELISPEPLSTCSTSYSSTTSPPPVTIRRSTGTSSLS